jgi:chromosome segregation ATPase
MERENRASMERRLRDECEKLKIRQQALEESDSLHRSQIIELEANNRSLLEMEVRNKQAISALQTDVEKKSKQIEDLNSRIKSSQEYTNKFQEHYNKKKVVFEGIERENNELRQKMFVAETELTELKTRLVQSESRSRSLIEENNCLKEKIKTVTFEKTQMEKKQDELMKQVGKFYLFIYRNFKHFFYVIFFMYNYF